MRHRPHSKLSKADKEVGKLHIEIVLFLKDLIQKSGSNLDPFEMKNFLASSSYAEAVRAFRREGIDPNKWFFSCDDKILLTHAEQLKEKFQVTIVSAEEGMARERNLKVEGQPVERAWCAGAPMMSKELHQGDEITDKEWFARKPVRKLQN